MSSADICAHGSPGCGPIGQDTGIRADPNHCDAPSMAKATSGKVCRGCGDFTCLHHLKAGRCRKCRGEVGKARLESTERGLDLIIRGDRTPKGIQVPSADSKSSERVKSIKKRATKTRFLPVTPEIVAAVLKRLKKPKKGIGVTSEAKRLNVAQPELSSALKAAGYVVKKGRKAR